MPRVIDRFVVPAAVAILVVAAISVSGALGAEDDTTFFACVRGGNGMLYNVTENVEIECRGKDNAISWSQSGSRGPGIAEVEADTLPAGSSASAELEPIANDPEGDQRLQLGIPQGEQGPPGPPGPQGEPGEGGVTGWELVRDTFTYEDVTEFSEQVNCPDNKIVIAGGASAGPLFPHDSVYHLESSHPVILTDEGEIVISGWSATGSTTQASGNAQLVVEVICADVEVD